jgi:hypothetical protein
MSNILIARAVADCATKVGSWSTAHLAHEQALLVQGELIKISKWLRERSEDIEASFVTGVYD